MKHTEVFKLNHGNLTDEKKFECEECTGMAPEWSRVENSEICFLCLSLTDDEIDEVMETAGYAKFDTIGRNE